MSLAKLNVLKSLNNMKLKQLLSGSVAFMLTLPFAFQSLAQEAVTKASPAAINEQTIPQVGKHVAGSNLDVASMLLSLLAVLILIVVAASLLKKFHLSPQLGKDLKVITSLHLGPKERLVVVEVNKKQLLLGVTAHNISVLQELEEPLSPAQPLPVDLASGFSKLLRKQ